MSDTLTQIFESCDREEVLKALFSTALNLQTLQISDDERHIVTEVLRILYSDIQDFNVGTCVEENTNPSE